MANKTDGESYIESAVCVVRYLFLIGKPMDKLDKFLRPALAKRGLLGAATSAEVCFLAEKWGKGRFNAISYSKGVLKLSVRSSSASSELSMEQETLISYLNEKLGRQSVQSVRIINLG